MAQDFDQAFGHDGFAKIGQGSKMIASQHMAAVNFYMIHALEKRTTDNRAEATELREENERLKGKVNDLEQRLQKIEALLTKKRV